MIGLSHGLQTSSEVANTFKSCKASCHDVGKGGRAFRLEEVRTLTSLSQPEETMTGFWGLGEKRTQDTHSVWPFSVMVNLQSPRVFHSLMERSREPETIWRLSAEKETERTSLVWPTKRRVVVPVESSHSLRVLSHEADRA